MSRGGQPIGGAAREIAASWAALYC